MEEGRGGGKKSIRKPVPPTEEKIRKGEGGVGEEEFSINPGCGNVWRILWTIYRHGEHTHTSLLNLFCRVSHFLEENIWRLSQKFANSTVSFVSDLAAWLTFVVYTDII